MANIFGSPQVNFHKCPRCQATGIDFTAEDGTTSECRSCGGRGWVSRARAKEIAEAMAVYEARAAEEADEQTEPSTQPTDFPGVTDPSAMSDEHKALFDDLKARAAHVKTAEARLATLRRSGRGIPHNAVPFAALQERDLFHFLNADGTPNWAGGLWEIMPETVRGLALSNARVLDWNTPLYQWVNPWQLVCPALWAHSDDETEV